MTNLKRSALALQNYADVYRVLPIGTCTPD